MQQHNTLRVGMIGCGFIGRYHASGLRAAVRESNGTIEWVAACDRHVERAEAFAERGGCTVVTDDAMTLAAGDAVDALYVCTETSAHPDVVLAALRSGKHVFCEKPLAITAPEARAMLDAAQAAGVVHQVGLVLRFSPVMRVIEELMAQDDLGPLLAVHLRDDQFFPIRGHYASQWRADVTKAGGGTLIEHSIHDVDLFLRLFGPVEQVRCRTRETQGCPGIENVAQVTFDHASGVTTQLASIWHRLDDRASTRRFEIFFEGGWIATEADYFGDITWQGRSGQPIVIPADEVLRRYVALEGLTDAQASERWIGSRGDHVFLDAARFGRPAMPDFATALSAHEVVDACYRSAAAGASIEMVRG